jgi:hypothetical protein
MLKVALSVVSGSLEFTVYVLISESTGRRYVGQTDDLPRRLAEHKSVVQNLAMTPAHARSRLGTHMYVGLPGLAGIHRIILSLRITPSVESRGEHRIAHRSKGLIGEIPVSPVCSRQDSYR